MCGILYVRSTCDLPNSLHDAALEILSKRGPDFAVSHRGPGVFVAQTVLHITGQSDFYHEPKSDFLAYNGEIYNYKKFGNYSTDTELVYHTVKHHQDQFKQFEGPWAWVYHNNDQVLYASDPQGERCLYHYQDSDLLIVSSEVAAILCYVNAQHNQVPYHNKCWTMIEQTPWTGVTRCRPGQLYINGVVKHELDSVWSWIKPQQHITLQDADQEFERIWTEVGELLQPNCAATLSYSAGLDSNIIMQQTPDLNLMAIDVIGKDPVIVNIKDFLNTHELDRLKTVSVDAEQWAQHYRELIQHTRMPAQTWSYVGKWLVAKHSADRVIFTGLAADELFGGYECYKTIQYDQTGSHSPYSHHDHDGLWQSCLEVYHGDPRPATLLMDYWYQVVGVDAPGLDRLGGAWGKETRNPFMTRAVMKFALNLPWELRVNTVSKPIVRNQFLRRWNNTQILPKMGFAGHANDSLPWMGVDVAVTGDRQQDWKQIAQQTFYEYTTI